MKNGMAVCAVTFEEWVAAGGQGSIEDYHRGLAQEQAKAIRSQHSSWLESFYRKPDSGLDRVAASFGSVRPAPRDAIAVSVVEHTEQPYDTPGLWQERNGCVEVSVSNAGDVRYNLLTALGLIVEQALCQQQGVTSEQITAFHLAHAKRRRCGESDYQGDPGHHPDAPHKQAHRFAEGLLKQLAPELGVVWSRYTRAKEAL